MPSSPRPLSLILTRPREQSGAWANRLEALGVAVLELPLIDIHIRQDAQTASRRRWAAQRLQAFAAVMHVSPNAVAGFWDAPTRAAWWQMHNVHGAAPRLWAPGPGTATALRATGFPQTHIDQPASDAALLDSEHLWQVVAPQLGPDKQVLIVRGSQGQDSAKLASQAETAAPWQNGTGRGWLAERIRAAGGQAVLLAVYDRGLPHWDSARRTLVLSWLAQQHPLLFSSSDAVGHLNLLLPKVHWGRQRAIATHPRIAQAASALGFGSVQTVQPQPEAIAGALQSPSLPQ